MNMKHISYFLFLLVTNVIHSSPFATRLILDKTKEQQPLQQKNPLFLQAEKCESDFAYAYKQCSQTDDCIANKQYRQARKSVISSIVELIYYIDSFEDDNTTDVDEKNEAENIKNQLIQLLEHTTQK